MLFQNCSTYFLPRYTNEDILKNALSYFCPYYDNEIHHIWCSLCMNVFINDSIWEWIKAWIFIQSYHLISEDLKYTIRAAVINDMLHLCHIQRLTILKPIGFHCLKQKYHLLCSVEENKTLRVCNNMRLSKLDFFSVNNSLHLGGLFKPAHLVLVTPGHLLTKYFEV